MRAALLRRAQAPVRAAAQLVEAEAERVGIHRIQETHTLLLHLPWDQVHVAPGEEDVL